MSQRVPTLRENLERLGLFLSQDRKIFWFMLIYAGAVGVFSLIIPLTVQEMVNTFAFAVTPFMVATLVGIMAGILLFAGVFRILQFYATDIVERRLFVRVTLALAKVLPRFKMDDFRAYNINQFFELVFLQRAFSSLFVDLTNVFVSGIIGMILLVLYHPYFIIFDIFLVIAIVVIAMLGKGGLRDTLEMSDAKYATFRWFQNIAENLLHCKSVNCSSIIQKRADQLASTYVQSRKSRFRALLRQYIGSIVLQVVIHTGLLGTAGWLLSQGELTVGQLVAAEVVVASLLLNMEQVIKRFYVIFYFFTALHELEHLFSSPQDELEGGAELTVPKSSIKQLHLQCNDLSWAIGPENNIKSIPFEAQPGEKWAIICPTEFVGHRVSRILAGLAPVSHGTILYNKMDVRSLAPNQVYTHRSVMFHMYFTLFEGTILDNITMGRQGISSQDLVWALQVTQLRNELDRLPHGLETPVYDEGQDIPPSLRIQILLARAIITRPPLLILEGALHEIPHQNRKLILENLCSPDHPWTLVIVTADPNIKDFTENQMSLTDIQPQ